MKIAVFHNALDNIGGAEIVGLTLAREFNATIFTTNIDREKIQKMGFENIRIESIGRIPINAPFRQQLALYLFRKLRLKEHFDYFIIDGEWALSGAVQHKPNIYLCHSPTRELWDLYQYTREHTVPRWGRWIFDVWVSWNRVLYKKYIDHVNHIICTSENSLGRMRKFLKRETPIIFPPTTTSQFFNAPNGTYWLSVNRLISHKRIEMQMETFRDLPQERLIIVGSYEKSRHFKRYAKRMHMIKPENVQILSWVDFEKLVDLYAHCKGVITTAKEEDFGMTAVEAMAAGKPVIAPDEGGYKETVVDGKTGRLIEDITASKLVEAIKELSPKAGQYKDACMERAAEFDTQRVVEKLKRVMNHEETSRIDYYSCL